jgi:hypothetical protein
VASNCCFYKIRMDTLFHDCHLFQFTFVNRSSPSVPLDSSTSVVHDTYTV